MPPFSSSPVTGITSSYFRFAEDRDSQYSAADSLNVFFDSAGALDDDDEEDADAVEVINVAASAVTVSAFLASLSSLLTSSSFSAKFSALSVKFWPKTNASVFASATFGGSDDDADFVEEDEDAPESGTKHGEDVDVASFDVADDDEDNLPKRDSFNPPNLSLGAAKTDEDEADASSFEGANTDALRSGFVESEDIFMRLFL